MIILKRIRFEIDRITFWTIIKKKFIKKNPFIHMKPHEIRTEMSQSTL